MRFERLLGKAVYRWQKFWVGMSRRNGIGRLAARLAVWNTMPYHCRAFLADLHPRGFVAPTAALAHPEIRLGANVYIGDGVYAFRSEGGGAIELHDGVQIYGNSHLHTGNGGRIVIGSGTHIQPSCYICAYVSEIKIGRKVEIAPECAFYCYNHSIAADVKIMDQPLKSRGSIIIGDGAWLGHRVIVLDGVEIGAGAVIGAGSVVTQGIPENAIAAGVPARVVKFREMRAACDEVQ